MIIPHDRPCDAACKSYPFADLDRALRLQEDEAPRFQDNQYVNVVMLSALRTLRLYPPATNFCWRLSRPEGHSAPVNVISQRPHRESNPRPSGL